MTNMKLNFNNLSLSQESFLAQSSGAIQGLSLTDLRTWWQNLSKGQKKEICMVNFSDVIRDLTDAANNALVLCKLNQSYKKKGLMSSEKLQTEDGEVHTFRFNLNGKDILDKNLALLFSCFQIHVVRSKNLSREGTNSKNFQKSHVKVDEEMLDSFIDILTSSVSNFGEGDKLVLKDENLLELYSFLTYNSSQNIVSDTSLHPYLKKLFERLADLAFLLECKIYCAYFESRIPQCQTASKKVSNQLDALSVLIGNYTKDLGRESAPQLAKTVSQLERECQRPEQSEGQNSTASVSPANPIISEPYQNLNSEELRQRLLQNTSDKNKLQEDSIYSPIGVYYEGFITGNLEIAFDPLDTFLIDDDSINSDEENTEEYCEEDKRSQISENERMRKVQIEELGFYNQKSQNQIQNPSFNHNPYYTASGPVMMTHPSAYNRYQPVPNRVEFYSPYHAQQVPTMMPNNYGFQTVYTEQRNAMTNPGYNHSKYLGDSQSYTSFESRPPRKDSFESISSYGSESLFSASKDKARYPKKPALPPRFQRMKENAYRN